MPTPRFFYPALDKIRRDDIIYDIGELVPLTEEHAANLYAWRHPTIGPKGASAPPLPDPEGGDTSPATLDAAIIELASLANRDLITVTNASQSGFGIATSAFHLSDDPGVVGTLYGQTISLEAGIPKDLYLVGASSDGLPGPGIEHNGTVTGVHITATWSGTGSTVADIAFNVVSSVRHHPGPGDWATRTYDSVVANQTIALNLLQTDFPLLIEGVQVSGTFSATVGNRVSWNRADALPDGWLPLNGQTVSAVDTEYPELWAVRGLSKLIDAFDDTAKTITLKDYNGQGRFLRAGMTAGVEQEQETSVDGITVSNSGAHTHGYVDTEHLGFTGRGTGGNVARQGRTENNQTTASAGDHTHDLVGGGAETRPINVSEIWCVVARS